MTRRDFLRRLPALPLAIAGVATNAAVRPPSYAIHLPGRVSAEVMDRVRSAFDAALRTGRTIVLERGVRIERLDR